VQVVVVSTRGMMLACAVLDSTANLPDCKSRAIRAVERSMQLAKSEGRAYTVNDTTVTSSDTPAEGQVKRRLGVD